VYSTGWAKWRTMFFRFMRKKRLGAAGLIIAVTFIALAVLAPLVGRYDPDEVFQAPNPEYKSDPSIAELAKNPSIGSPFKVNQYAAPDPDHWFGTDSVGRDIYSRIVHGAELSLTVGFGASILAVTIGLLLGVPSGYYGGWLDLILQRFVDALQAFPALVLLLLLVQIAEPSVRNTVLALGIIGVPTTTRLTRSAVLGIASRDYVAAARAAGATDLRIMVRHVLPNIAAIVVITFSIGIGAYILFEATISFLGVGPSNVVSWGKMAQEGRGNIEVHPWLSIFSGLSIALLVVAFNFLGDALRDELDPRLRGSR
jgi:peptide/nickel transport system permease protein